MRLKDFLELINECQYFTLFKGNRIGKFYKDDLGIENYLDNEIIDKVREEINNINLVVIDYLYLAIEKDDNDIKECLRKLKVLSRILNIPIIVLHELEENIDKLLILNECDIVLFMNKINDTNNYEIVVEKNCYGPLGTIKLKLDDKLMTFKGI